MANFCVYRASSFLFNFAAEGRVKTMKPDFETAIFALHGLERYILRTHEELCLNPNGLFHSASYFTKKCCIFQVFLYFLRLLTCFRRQPVSGRL